MATRGLLNVVGSFIHHNKKDDNEDVTCMGGYVWIARSLPNLRVVEGDILIKSSKRLDGRS